MNIYEVNIRQYTPEGTFAAFAKHLPRLKDMGVEVLWLMPVTPISREKRQGSLGSYYACSDYTAVNPEFGTIDDFKNLVDSVHAVGMRLILDWVANHTGWDHRWTKEHPDWYMHDAQGNLTEKNGWIDVVDLDYRSHDMRAAMIASMKHWVEKYDIDGFRCDMAHLVPLDFWAAAKQSCGQVKPLYWLAECETVSYHEVFNTTYAWWWMHVAEAYANGNETLETVRNVLHAYTQYPPGASKLYFTSNHDENSWNGTEYEKYGNAARAWAVFSCTWEGIPLLYSGQEIPNRKRLAFFEKDPIDWTAGPLLHGFYQKLLSLRKRNKAICGGETYILPSDANNQLMAFMRKKDNDRVLVLLNVSNDRAKINVSHEWLRGRFLNLFSGLNYSFTGEEQFELQGGEYMVYEFSGAG